MSIIAVFFADTTATVDLVLSSTPGAPSIGPNLLELKIDPNASGGPALVPQNHISGALAFNTVQTRVLQPGVYFFATDGEIRYDLTEGRCRSIFLNGKTPVPPPPPPAPLGTDLDNYSSVYSSMFSNVVITANAGSGRQWMVVGLEERSAS